MILEKLRITILVSVMISSCGSDGTTTNDPLNTHYDFAGDAPLQTSPESEGEESDVITPELLQQPAAFNSVEGATLEEFLSQLTLDEVFSDVIPDTAPVVASLPGSMFESTIAFVDDVARKALDGLNKKIEGGETISAEEQACFHEYDSGLGEPLLSLRCETRQIAFDDQLTLQTATYANTEECQNSLLAGNSEGCAVVQASISIAHIPIESSITSLPTTDSETFIDGFLENDVVSTVIQFGGTTDQTLNLKFSTLSISEDLECTYLLSTGQLLSQDKVESCAANMEQLTPDLQSVNL